MKKILIIILCSVSSFIQAQSLKVLFIGNSYTYVNDLPGTVAGVTAALDDTLLYDSSAPGSYTFQLHSTNATTISKINSQQWDYVVLQEQSQLPSFPSLQVATDCYPFAHALDSIIVKNDSCTETMFYMTWGRQNGDASNCASYPPVCTYEGMQQRLRESYLEMSFNNHASVSPVGVAWKHIRDNYPSINLYQSDESHPSIYGTYLAACVFYASMFHKSTIGCSYVLSGISPSDALILQTVASTTVLDSLSLWQGNGDIPNPVFTFSVEGNTVSFINTSFNADSIFWNFGDGSYCSLISPSHTYSAIGYYPVSLTAFNDCKQVTIVDTVYVGTAEISKFSEDVVKIFPNPVSDILTISVSLSKSLTYSIFNISGHKIMYGNLLNSMNNINIERLSNGVYFIEYSDNLKSIGHQMIIKESKQ